MERKEQPDKGGGFGKDDLFQDMMLFPMADLMGQHGKDLLLGHLLDQRIEQNNAFDASDAR